MPFTFKIWEKIKEAWSLYKKNLLEFSTIAVFCVFVNYLDRYVFVKIPNSSIILNIFAYLFTILAGAFLLFILVHFIDSLLKKNEVKLFTKDILPKLSEFLNFFLIVFLGDLIITINNVTPVIIGNYLYGNEGGSLAYALYFEPYLLLFLLFLMIYLFTKLVFSIFIMLEKKQNVFKSIKESWKMTKGYVWKFFWRFLLLEIIIINLVLNIPFFLGVSELSLVVLFVLLPLGVIFLFVLYRDFSNFKQNNLILPKKEEVSKEEK